MAYQLTIEQMAEALDYIGTPEARALIRQVETVGSAMAKAIAKHGGMIAGECSYDMGLLCSPFGPKTMGDPIPVFILGMDEEEEWGEECPSLAQPEDQGGEENPFHPESPEGRAWEAEKGE